MRRRLDVDDYVIAYDAPSVPHEQLIEWCGQNGIYLYQGYGSFKDAKLEAYKEGFRKVACI